MSSLLPGQSVVAEGTYLYDNTVECRLRIIYSPMQFGTGDSDDDLEIANDVVRDAFYIEYESTTDQERFNAGGGSCASLEEAKAKAESTPGIGHTIRWRR
jgi:hypothetical protein